MCGIAGYFLKNSTKYKSNSLQSEFNQKLKKSSLLIKHRGPDDDGIFFDLDRLNSFATIIKDLVFLKKEKIKSSLYLSLKI